MLIALEEGATEVKKTQNKHAPSSGEILNYKFDLPIPTSPSPINLASSSSDHGRDGARDWGIGGWPAQATGSECDLS